MRDINKIALKQGFNSDEVCSSQFAIDEYGVIVSIASLTAAEHKGNKCGLFHLITNDPVQACCLNHDAKKIRYFRTKADAAKTPRKGSKINESNIHKLVCAFFDNVEHIEVDGFKTNLTGYTTNKRLTVLGGTKKDGNVLAFRIPDVWFNECVIEIVLTHEVEYKTRMLYEGSGLHQITVRYEADQGNNLYNKYLKMSISEIKDDILSRCEYQKPLREAVIEPYAQRVHAIANKKEESERQLNATIAGLKQQLEVIKSSDNKQLDNYRTSIDNLKRQNYRLQSDLEAISISNNLKGFFVSGEIVSIKTIDLFLNRSYVFNALVVCCDKTGVNYSLNGYLTDVRDWLTCLSVGLNVSVNFTIKGNEKNGRHFNSFHAIKVRQLYA